ncbi:MAG: ABC transporter substrate-binding protein [Campylobacterota bacterium]
MFFFVHYLMIKRLPIIIFIFLVSYIYFKDEVFPKDDLKIGISLPKTGILSSWGDSVQTGIDAYFKYANDKTVLENKKLKLIIYDDKYEPELTYENTNRLIFNDKVFALFGFVGTPTVKNILPILHDEEIPFFGAFTGASFLRNSNHNNFVNLRSSYKQEIEKIVDYLYKKKDIKKIAVFYQNDDYGEEGYISLLNALEKRELSLVAQGSYKRNTLSIGHAFNEIKDAKPEAIIMVGANKANALFIKKAKASKELKNTTFCNISFGDANSMVQNLTNLNVTTKNLIFSQVMPYYENDNIEVIKEYKAAMRKYYPNKKLGFISLEAFLSSKVLVNAISNIKGELTRQKLLYMLKNTHNSLLKGIKIDYKNSQLLNETYLFEYDKSKFKEIKWQ